MHQATPFSSFFIRRGIVVCLCFVVLHTNPFLLASPLRRKVLFYLISFDFPFDEIKHPIHIKGPRKKGERRRNPERRGRKLLARTKKNNMNLTFFWLTFVFETICFLGNILGLIGVDLAGWINFRLTLASAFIKLKKVGTNNVHVASDPKKKVIWLSNHRTFTDFFLDHVLTGRSPKNASEYFVARLKLWIRQRVSSSLSVAMVGNGRYPLQWLDRYQRPALHYV